MNKRLFDKYANIEIQNRESFLNNDLELDTTWGNEIWGVTFQIDLSESARDVVCKYQEELDELEPGNLLLLPRQYQHISFNQVVFWGGEYVMGREKTWDNVAPEFLAAFQKLNKTFSGFEITFSKLIATKGGIIWVASDEKDELENLRNVFLNAFPFPEETTKFNHIIHTTVARYKNRLNSPKKVLTYIENKHDKMSMYVSKIILRKELVFPSIKTEEIASIDLV